MKNRIGTCCFCGTRPQNLPYQYNEQHSLCIGLKEKLKIDIVELITKKNVKHFCFAMLLGVDIWALEILAELKEIHSDIILEYVDIHPFEDELQKNTQRVKREILIDHMSYKTKISSRTHQESVKLRNQYMITKSDYTIFLWDLSSGPTSNALAFAKRLNKKIICYNAHSNEYFEYDR